jgi:8-oxo-dGTP pyrophosphatase MutT (NUDIX family)
MVYRHTDTPDKSWRRQRDIDSINSNQKEVDDKMPYDKGVRKSSGIACCRFNKDTSRLEVLLVKKRYTYSFVAFVFGQYNKKDEKRLKFLFNGMTLQEKIDILSLKFDMMWYKIWLEFPEISMQPKFEFDVSSAKAISNTWKALYKQKATSNFVPYNVNSISKLDFYIKRKNKFEASFVSDNGKRLRSLISNTKNNELIWEIPKGRKNRKETVLDCAIREFKEETSVDIDMYTIMFNIKPIVESYVSANVKYVHNYYTAYTSKTFDPTVSFSYDTQISEIDSIRWVNLNEIKFIDHSGRLYSLVQRVFHIFKSKYKHIKSE